jgi:hypothetical protein
MQFELFSSADKSFFTLYKNICVRPNVIKLALALFTLSGNNLEFFKYYLWISQRAFTTAGSY